LKHYFSSLGEPGAFSIKKYIGTHYAGLVFLHPVGSMGYVVHFGAYAARNVDALFFCLGWVQYRFDKKSVRTRYAEHVFLHPMRSACHVVRSSASSAQNVDALFFKLEWD
jgi:hypothetical protein